MSKPPPASQCGRVVRAFVFARAGLLAAWRHEAAFRQEVCLIAVLFPLACWLAADGVERALMIGALLLVLMVELLNSAIEATVDRIGVERHELSGRAKDLAAAAVFLSLINVPIVWGCLLFDRAVQWVVN